MLFVYMVIEVIVFSYRHGRFEIVRFELNQKLNIGFFLLKSNFQDLIEKIILTKISITQKKKIYI